MIVAILNPKGGSGKSTLTTNLARSLQHEGHAVLIVDTDPQGTMRDWQAMQGENSDQPPVVGVDTKRIVSDLGRISMAYDVVVIDGTAKMMQGLGRTVKVADLILIPVQPSAADLWAVAGLAELIRTRQQIYNGLPRAGFVVSRQVVGTKLAAEIEAALEEFGLPILKSRLSQRIAYAEALSEGVSVLDLEPHGKAAAEVRSLTHEVIEVFSGAYQRALELRRIRVESKELFNDAYQHALTGHQPEDGQLLSRHAAAHERDRRAASPLKLLTPT